MTKAEWYQRNNCSHAHCPCNCSKPQPLMVEKDRFVCGACYFKHGVVCEMIPCTPETCGDDE